MVSLKMSFVNGQAIFIASIATAPATTSASGATPPQTAPACYHSPIGKHEK